MELQDLTTRLNKHKVYHLEAYQDEKLFIGTNIKANTLEEAKIIMQVCFIDSFKKDTEIHLVEENWIH